MEEKKTAGQMLDEMALENEYKEHKHKFLDHILRCCDVDEISGAFRCKKCGSLVAIDWFENTIECSGDCECNPNSDE